MHQIKNKETRAASYISCAADILPNLLSCNATCTKC